MRTVVAFPGLPRAEAEAVLDRVGEREEGRWVFADLLYVHSFAQAAIFDDWLWKDVNLLVARLGRLPEWGLVISVSGLIPGHQELRWLLSGVLGPTGVVIDEYSDHPWTPAEINAGVADGRTFFDPPA